MMKARIFFKSFLANFRNYIIFFLSSMVSVSVIFTLISIYGMISGFKTGEVFTLSRGSGRIIKDAILIIAILTFFLMMFSIQFYVRTRIKGYTLFEILGVKRKDVNRMKAFEYIGSNVCALLFGMVLGNILSILCKKILENFYFQGKELPYPGIKVYWYTTGVAILIFGIAFVVNAMVSEETNMIQGLTGARLREKKPYGKWRKIGFLIGIAMLILGICSYRVPMNVESMTTILLFVFGVCLCIYYGMSKLLDRRRKNCKAILEEQNFRFQYRSNMVHIFILVVLQFFTFFYYPVQILSNVPSTVKESDYPYDFIWKMDRFQTEETELLEMLQETYQADCKIIPSATVTVPFGDNTSTGVKEVYNQGQNLAIPESAYEELTGEKLHLKEKEIVVVLQQGKEKPMHPLDFFWYGETYLHFGPANPEFFDYIKIPTMLFSDEYTVRETIRKNVIGSFAGGRCENLVVFSDKVFQDIEEIRGLDELLYYDVHSWEADGKRAAGYVPKDSAHAGFVNRLILLHVPEKYLDDVHEIFEKRYPLEYANAGYDGNVRRYYDSREAAQNLHTTRIQMIIMYSIVFGIFIFAMIFIMFLKMFSEQDIMAGEERFYHMFGMKEREIKKTLFYRWRMIFLGTSLLSGGSGVVFTCLTLKMRQFTSSEIVEFMESYFGIVIGILFLQWIIYQVAKFVMWKKIMED